MFMVRGAALLLASASVAAVVASALVSGRGLDVDPDLGPERVLVVPAGSEESRARPPSTRPSHSPGPDARGGARTDPPSPVPVEPHDETDDPGGSDRRADPDDRDVAQDPDDLEGLDDDEAPDLDDEDADGDDR